MDKTLTQASIDFISGNTSQVPSDSVLAAGQAIFEAKFDQFVALWVPLWQTWVALDFLMLGVGLSLHSCGLGRNSLFS